MGHDLGFLVVGIAHAVLRNLDAADADAQLVADGFFAGLADGHDNAAPIGVFTGNGGFHQWRIGNRHGYPVSRLVGLSACDGDFDKLLCALAIARNLLRQIKAQAIEPLGESL